MCGGTILHIVFGRKNKIWRHKRRKFIANPRPTNIMRTGTKLDLLNTVTTKAQPL
jgi:hypothetical protein